MMHKLSLIACDLVMMVIIEIKEIQLCGTNGIRWMFKIWIHSEEINMQTYSNISSSRGYITVNNYYK